MVDSWYGFYFSSIIRVISHLRVSDFFCYHQFLTRIFFFRFYIFHYLWISDFSCYHQFLIQIIFSFDSMFFIFF